MKKARLINDTIVLTFMKISENEFKKIYKTISELPRNERKYISTSKEWEVVCNEKNYKIIRDLNFEIPQELFQKMNNLVIDESWKKINVPEKYDYLYPDQKESFQYILAHDGKGILGDAMGGGKTNVSLSLVDYLNEFPVLIVCPTSLKTNWIKEHTKWISSDDRILAVESSADMKDYNDEVDIVIINYQLLARGMKKIKVKGGAGYLFMPLPHLEAFATTASMPSS